MSQHKKPSDFAKELLAINFVAIECDDQHEHEHLRELTEQMLMLCQPIVIIKIYNAVMVAKAMITIDQYECKEYADFLYLDNNIQQYLNKQLLTTSN